MSNRTLSEEQLERYSRHIMLEEIGEQGQEKLLKSRVLIIGAGGLGSPAAMYLAAAGIGTIGIADADSVDLSNLQRQIIHSAADRKRDKVQSAKETLEGINPDAHVNTYKMFVNSNNIYDLIKDYDFVLDCTDNFQSKFLINDACVKAKKPFVHAGIAEFQGQLMTYVPDMGPCCRCIFEKPPVENDVKGVVGAAVGVIGSLQAMEAVKYLLGAGELLTGCILTYDALKAEFRKVRLPDKVNDCPICGKGVIK